MEKDFQTIKGVVNLRPVRHRIDEKVRAHVTLCMLALRLQRTLECRLRAAGHRMTAPAAFEMLADLHLNVLELPDSHSIYQLTRPRKEQRQLVEALGLAPLLDQDEVRQAIRPR